MRFLLVFAAALLSSCASPRALLDGRVPATLGVGGCGGAGTTLVVRDGASSSSVDTEPSSWTRRARRAERSTDGGPACRMGTDGRQACGYHCRMGTDGVVACADTPDGVCAMGTDGRVTCSQVARGRFVDDDTPPPECRMGTDGRRTCGYNCRMGTNGRFSCASRPDGRCAMNTDGSFSCS